MSHDRLPARSVAFKCEVCGKKKSVKLAAGVSTPTRVDCDGCDTRDAVVPVRRRVEP